MEYINPSNKSSIKKKKKEPCSEKNLLQTNTQSKSFLIAISILVHFPIDSNFIFSHTIPISFELNTKCISLGISLSLSLSSDTAYHQVREGWTRSNKRGIQGDKQLARLFDGQTPINHSEVAERGVGEEGGCQAKSK